MLNSSTGALTITGLTRDDSGSYTVQINNSSITKTTQLLVICKWRYFVWSLANRVCFSSWIQILVVCSFFFLPARVSKPSVSTWCEPEMSYCLFTCEGNTTDAEPIEYLWSASDISRLSSAKVYNLTKVWTGWVTDHDVGKCLNTSAPLKSVQIRVSRLNHPHHCLVPVTVDNLGTKWAPLKIC